MGFKGITWVGDIYQKFETMCLEAEEIMYQDTLKYVENQVQTVGASVKKMYSDVVQDLLPPSCVDPVKFAAEDFSFSDGFGIYKKPKPTMKEDSIRVEKQVARNPKMTADANSDRSSSFNELRDACHLSPPSSVGLMSVNGLELCSGQSANGGNFQRPSVATKRKSKRNNHLSSAMLSSITPASNNLSRVSLCTEISENHVALGSNNLSRVSVCSEISENHDGICDQIVKAPCSASFEISGVDTREGGKQCNSYVSSTVSVANVSTGHTTSEMIAPDGSCLEKETELESTHSSCGPGICRIVEQVFPKELCASGCAQHSESANEDDSSYTEISGDGYVDFSDNDGMVVTGLDIIEQFDNSKLEETCVLVDGDKLSLMSCIDRKPRSYKKKIKKAFSSKRSARRQEYEQLAVQHGNMDTGSSHNGVGILMPTAVEDADTEQFPTRVSCESEWELL